MVVCPAGHGRFFKNSAALRDHQIATGHCYCEECDSLFDTAKDFKQHNARPPHVSQYHCCDCAQDFVTQAELIDHLDNNKHKRLTRTCTECRRTFVSVSIL